MSSTGALSLQLHAVSYKYPHISNQPAGKVLAYDSPERLPLSVSGCLV
jgi:hypothetical protein